jgi:hypothetical protein
MLPRILFALPAAFIWRERIIYALDIFVSCVYDVLVMTCLLEPVGQIVSKHLQAVIV